MGLFVVFEGPDGAGKSTQTDLLGRSLQAHGVPVTVTREPGGTQIGDAIRDIMLGSNHKPLLPLTQAFLMNAARAELVSRIIRPTLAHDGVVISDRFWYSTLAYQSAGDGVPEEAVRQLATIATEGLQPDIVFFLNIPVSMGLGRKQESEKNTLDLRPVEFHGRASKAYLHMADLSSDIWMTLDATRSREDLADEILNRTLALAREKRTSLTGH